MRTAAKVDRNQAEIVAALRRVGATVTPLHRVGEGVPDLLVGYRGRTHLLEVKDWAKPPAQRPLTPDQAEWCSQWRGAEPLLVLTVDDALRAIGATVGPMPRTSRQYHTEFKSRKRQEGE